METVERESVEPGVGRLRRVAIGSVIAVFVGSFTLTGCGGPKPSPVGQSGGATDSVGPIGSGGGVVTVAAASDLKFVLDEVIEKFERSDSAARVTVSYGSSGSFFAQLSNRAPYDVFLSADLDYARRLADAGLADGDTLFRYAIGRLVVWVRRDSALDVEGRGIGILTDPSVRRVAIANPQHAPYGRAAQAALQHFGIHDRVADRLVLGENIAQAAQFVDTGAADAGVIALSLALAPALRDRGRYWVVPADTYPALEQGGVILSWAKDRGAAERFCRYLRHGDAVEILKAYGFDVSEN